LQFPRSSSAGSDIHPGQRGPRAGARDFIACAPEGAEGGVGEEEERFGGDEVSATDRAVVSVSVVVVVK
jgi:hypothetical protein